jgi:general secretion pathway protein H
MEIMVVVAIVAGIMIFAAPKMGGALKVSINSAARELATTAKESYNSAVMSGRVHRLAYDLKKQEFWAESGPANVLLDTKESKEKEERRKKFARDDDKPPPSEFSLAPLVTRKKISLPRGVTFEDVQTEQKPEPITTGMAYTHFFPHGISERTIIHIKDESNHHYTLILSPLVGRTNLLQSYVKGDSPDAQL